MRIKQIKNKEVRELALAEMSKQTGLELPYYKNHLLNLHLMLLDWGTQKTERNIGKPYIILVARNHTETFLVLLAGIEKLCEKVK